VSDELDQLLGLLVDDLIDEPGVARLHDLLVGDPAARLRYRRFLAVHSALRWDYAAVARDPREQPARPAQPHWDRWLPLGAVAAALVAALVLAWSMRHGPSPSIITAVDINGGTLTWSDGSHRQVLAGGESIGAGQLTLEGASASATLRFADGSTITLSGDSEVAASEDGQKRLQLHNGALTADVTPQPAGKPLLVRTGTAELQVVGTRFTVTTDASQTALDVEHGLVRLERLADGQQVEVGALQSATASLDTVRDLHTVVHERPATAWTLDLSHQPPATWTGIWVAPHADVPALMRAAPYVAARNAQGAPLIHQGVRIIALDGADRPFVRFVAGSVLTVRFRVARPDGRAHVDVMVCTHTGSGAFGGTFTAAIQPELLPASPDGWRTAQLHVTDFVSTRPTQRSMVDRDAVFILPRTITAATGLEIAGLSVSAP
jgi:ferric-dicitrate binding protein FerR (iron transport regulator)